MSRKKNKQIGFQKLLAKIFPHYDNKRAIKDIENSFRHKPKGKR